MMPLNIWLYLHAGYYGYCTSSWRVFYLLHFLLREFSCVCVCTCEVLFPITSPYLQIAPIRSTNAYLIVVDQKKTDLSLCSSSISCSCNVVSGRSLCTGWEEPLHWVGGASALGGRSLCTGWEELLHWVGGASALGGRSLCTGWEELLHWVGGASVLGGRSLCTGWEEPLHWVGGASALGGRSFCIGWEESLLEGN